MNSLRSDSIIFRGNILFPSLSTSTNFLRRLYARIHKWSFILHFRKFVISFPLSFRNGGA